MYVFILLLTDKMGTVHKKGAEYKILIDIMNKRL